METVTNGPSSDTLLLPTFISYPNILLTPNSLGIGTQTEPGEARGAKLLPEETHGSQSPGEGAENIQVSRGICRGKTTSETLAVAPGILVFAGWNREPRARLLREQQEQHPQHPPCGAGSIGTIC